MRTTTSPWEQTKGQQAPAPAAVPPPQTAFRSWIVRSRLFYSLVCSLVQMSVRKRPRCNKSVERHCTVQIHLRFVVGVVVSLLAHLFRFRKTVKK